MSVKGFTLERLLMSSFSAPAASWATWRRVMELRFVPQTGYTGPVEIPYVALNAGNVPIASGLFSLAPWR